MTYSQTSDMLIGDVFTDETKKLKHVTLASKEVDEKLGFKFSTPFDESAVSGPAWNLISRIANFIASGRFLLESDQSGEENGVHAYGQSLLNEANLAIKAILDGDVNLYPDTGDPQKMTAPHSALVTNVDPYSQVEAFYGFTARPAYGGRGPFLFPVQGPYGPYYPTN